MGVQIRERVLSNGFVTFDCDCYHAGQRMSVKTGQKVDPNKKRDYNNAKRAAEVKATEIEELLKTDPAAVFEKKQRGQYDFMEYCKNLSKERNNPPPWTTMIMHLSRFQERKLPISQVNEVFASKFRSYLGRLEGCNSTTRRNYLITFKIALKSAAKDGYIPDFTSRLANFKIAETRRNFLTVEQIEALSAADCQREDVRYAFLFSCFTGMRLSDVEKLTFGDVQMIQKRRYIAYQQKKSKKHELLPLNKQAEVYLENAASLHVKQPEEQKCIFALPSRSTIQIALERWGENAGLPFHLHFHISRHTYATLSLQGGVPIYNLSKMMGHSTVAMTEIYSHMISEAKIAAVDALPTLPSFKMAK
jgi:integrase